MLRYNRCDIVILMAATAWWCCPSVPVSCADLIRVPYFSSVPREILIYELNQHSIQELKDNISHAVTAISITVLHPVYRNMIRRAQLCIDAEGNHLQHRLWWHIFLHLATVLISVFTLCYGPGLLFRGPSYTLEFMKQLYTKLIKYLNKFQNSYSKLKPYTIILSFTIFSSSQAHLRFPSHFFQTFLLFLVTINFSFTLPSIYILNNSCTLQYRDHLVLSAKYIQWRQNGGVVFHYIAMHVMSNLNSTYFN